MSARLSDLSEWGREKHDMELSETAAHSDRMLRRDAGIRAFMQTLTVGRVVQYVDGTNGEIATGEITRVETERSLHEARYGAGSWDELMDGAGDEIRIVIINGQRCGVNAFTL